MTSTTMNAHHGHLAVGLPEHQPNDDRPADEGRHDHRVDRAPSLLGPVDVLEMQDQRILIEGQAAADAESGGKDLEPGAGGLDREREKAGEDQEHDPEHEVMDVQTPLGLDAARPPRHLRASHQPSADPDEHEGEQEAEQQDEAGAATGVASDGPATGDLIVISARAMCTHHRLFVSAFAGVEGHA